MKNCEVEKEVTYLWKHAYLEHCIVELKTDKRNILLVSAYRPPNTNARTFLTEYKKTARQTKETKRP